MWLRVLRNVNGILDIRQGPQVLVVEVFCDALSTRSSLRGGEVLRAVMTAATLFVAMTLVYLSWSMSLAGRYRFSKCHTR